MWSCDSGLAHHVVVRAVGTPQLTCERVPQMDRLIATRARETVGQTTADQGPNSDVSHVLLTDDNCIR